MTNSDQSKREPSRGPGLWGLPLGALSLAALVIPAVAAFVLLRAGISHRSGGSIAVGALVGAFWLMLLVQTARAAVGTANEVRD